MSTATAPQRTTVSPPAMTPAAESSASLPEGPTSDAWFGDWVALAVWLGGAAIIGVLLVKDLVFAQFR